MAARARRCVPLTPSCGGRIAMGEAGLRASPHPGADHCWNKCASGRCQPCARVGSDTDQSPPRACLAQRGSPRRRPCCDSGNRKRENVERNRSERVASVERVRGVVQPRGAGQAPLRAEYTSQRHEAQRSSSEKTEFARAWAGLGRKFQAATGDGRLVLRGVARREPFCSS
jgi:hypothetical protein